MNQQFWNDFILFTELQSIKSVGGKVNFVNPKYFISINSNQQLRAWNVNGISWFLINTMNVLNQRFPTWGIWYAKSFR